MSPEAKKWAKEWVHRVDLHPRADGSGEVEIDPNEVLALMGMPAVNVLHDVLLSMRQTPERQSWRLERDGVLAEVTFIGRSATRPPRFIFEVKS